MCLDVIVKRVQDWSWGWGWHWGCQPRIQTDLFAFDDLSSESAMCLVRDSFPEPSGDWHIVGVREGPWRTG